MLYYKHILFAFVLFFSLAISGQNEPAKDSIIVLDIQVFVNDKIIVDSTYLLDIINLTTEVYSRINTSNNFELTLNYNTMYEISIGYKGTNVKVITIDTNAPRDNWYIKTPVKLQTSRKKKRIIAGRLVYDYNIKTFVKKKPD